MSKCNLLKPLSNNNGNFFMFSQYSDDLTKEYTQKDQYRVIPSKFVAMNIDAQKFDNNSIAKIFQNYYENACSFFRTKLEEEWSPELASSLLWQTMIREGLISVEDTTPIKYIGDINIYSTQEIDGTSYNEIYCYIGNNVVDKKYEITSSKDADFYSCNSPYICGFENEYDSLSKDPTAEYINGLPLGPVYDSDDGEPGYSLNNYVLDTEGESLGDEHVRLATSFDINTIVVLYDIENVEGDKSDSLHSNIPMGIYFTGKIEQGEIKNGIKKYIQNAEVYGQGTSYGLRICTRYMSYPNAVVFQDTVVVGTDKQEENMTSILSKMNDSQVMMREALNRVVENSSNLKNHYNQFKGNLVNVPYIQTVGGVSYWFVNGRNTETKVLDMDDVEINIQEISEDDINLIFKEYQITDTE